MIFFCKVRLSVCYAKSDIPNNSCLLILKRVICSNGKNIDHILEKDSRFHSHKSDSH